MNLAFVSLPNSITEIKERTFYYCHYLRNITIPDSIKYIGNGAFDYSGL